jgi:hypothetical protein
VRPDRLEWRIEEDTMAYEDTKHKDEPRDYAPEVDDKIRQCVGRALKGLDRWKAGDLMAIHEARTALASANSAVWWFARDGKSKGSGSRRTK